MHKLRLLRIFLLSLSDTRPTDMLRPVTCRFMVSPFDVELTHASSHAYMAWAGLGRWSWNFANIDMRRMLRERWTPFTHSELVYYRRAVGIFSMVDMTTTLVWWDEKMAYFEHRMTQGGQLAAIVYSRGACYAAGKRIPIDQCSKGAQPVLPAVRPDIVNAWTVADVEFKKGA